MALNWLFDVKLMLPGDISKNWLAQKGVGSPGSVSPQI